MPVNVLILGLGSIGRRHARILRTIAPEARLFALRSGKGWGPEEGVTDIHDIAEIPGKTDLAIISSPTDLHPAHIDLIAPLRPFLFIEKPLALTAKEGERIADTVDQAGIKSYVGCQLRFLPALRELHDELREHPRPIVSASTVCRSWMPDWQPGRDYRESFRASLERSGGVHLELIHELDYMIWLLGNPESRTVTLGRSPLLEMSAWSDAHYELRYPGFTATIDLSYASKERERVLKVQFADGGVREIDLFVSPEELNQVYTAQMRHTLACMAGTETSLHTVRESLKTLTLALP